MLPLGIDADAAPLRMRDDLIEDRGLERSVLGRAPRTEDWKSLFGAKGLQFGESEVFGKPTV
jgi:hypothetical protein